MNKRPTCKPKNNDRCLSTNEVPTVVSCTRCGRQGHNRTGCNQPIPSKPKRKSVSTRASIETSTPREGPDEAAMMDEERYRNGRIYMGWDEFNSTQLPPAIPEGIEVVDWQWGQWRFDSYDPYINYLSQRDDGNYYESQPRSSIQSNN